MTSNDKDFRFMAINDLMAELQKDSIKLDDESERRVKYLTQKNTAYLLCLSQVVTALSNVLYVICIHYYFQLFSRLFICF